MEKILESYIETKEEQSKGCPEPVIYHITEKGNVYKTETISYGSQLKKL